MRSRADVWRHRLLGAWSALALLYLFVPIFVVALFSFNDNKGRFNLTWEGFTLDHWAHPFGVQGIGIVLVGAYWFVLMVLMMAKPEVAPLQDRAGHTVVVTTRPRPRPIEPFYPAS